MVLTITDPQLKVVVYCFTRVVFGVSASPFLLNATLNYHIEKYRNVDPVFVDQFTRSVYVDDIVTGSHSDDSAYEFYLKSKLRLSVANFNLRKFVTNSVDLCVRIGEKERELNPDISSRPVKACPSQVDVSDSVSDVRTTEVQVLGLCWDFTSDTLHFSIDHVARLMKDMQPTKRNVVSLATRFFDPLGVISPITVRFKLLFQALCCEKTDWDKPLEGTLQTQWRALNFDLQEFRALSVPRRYFDELLRPSTRLSVVGYITTSLCCCDLPLYGSWFKSC